MSCHRHMPVDCAPHLCQGTLKRRVLVARLKLEPSRREPLPPYSMCYHLACQCRCTQKTHTNNVCGGGPGGSDGPCMLLLLLVLLVMLRLLSPLPYTGKKLFRERVHFGME